MEKINKSRERLVGEDRKRSSVLFNRHIASYYFSLPLTKGKTVIDLGCSDGYGSSLIAKSAKEIIALDIDRQTIEEARKKYKNENLKFKIGNALMLNWKNKFDIVVSFQVIEHIKDVGMYLNQINKILKDKGIFICSTPNRLLRLSKGQKPWNKFHVHEYEAEELLSILKNHFLRVDVFGLHASRDIYEVEKKRLRLRRLISKFDLFGLYDKVPREFSDIFLVFLKRVLQNKVKKEKEANSNTFWINKNKLNESLDLIAICRK